MPNFDLVCQQIAMKQHAVISREQALATGMSPAALHRRAKSGRWERILPGVYRMSGSPSTWMQSLFAAMLWAGDRGVACGITAGWLWKLDGCGEDTIEVMLPRWRAAPGGIVVRQTRLGRDEIVVRSDIRLTTVERTLLDLAARANGRTAELALEDALRRRLTTTSRLLERLDGCWRAVPGAPALRKLASRHSSQSRHSETAFESKLFALLRRGKLPPPSAQYEIRDRSRLIARVDFAYPESRFIIEAHSYRWHSGHRSWERDVQRDKELRRLGWRILYVTYEDVTARPQEVLRDVRAGLGESQLFA